jgi:hypothetical protein
MVGTSDTAGSIHWERRSNVHPLIRLDQLLDQIDNILPASKRWLDPRKIAIAQKQRLRNLQQLALGDEGARVAQKAKVLRMELASQRKSDPDGDAWVYCLENMEAPHAWGPEATENVGASFDLQYRIMKPISSEAVFNEVLQEIRESPVKLALVLLPVSDPQFLKVDHV